VVGLDTFEKVMDERYYSALKGGILEALGKLFPDNVKVYLYPSIIEKTKELLHSNHIKWPDETRHLYQHLIENRKIIDIHDAKTNFLSIRSHEVLELLRQGKTSWEKQVPVFIAKRIKARKLFGYSE